MRHPPGSFLYAINAKGVMNLARNKKTPFAVWETMRYDGIEKRYIRMGNSQMLHPVVFNLSHSAYRVYTCMKLESGGRIAFEFPKSK